MDVNEDDLIGDPPSEVPKHEPTASDCMGKRTEKRGDEKVFVGYCRSHPGRGTDHVGEGRCKHHGGRNSGENGQGAPEGNDNAVTHGAYATIATRPLTEGEQEAFAEIESDLEDPESAREAARKAATYCLLMGHRAGDDRWFRRFEGICEKFGITPEDELTVTHEGLEDAFMSNLKKYHKEN